MGLFGRGNDYDRARILDAAGKAKAKNRRRTAIRLYRRVLAIEPGNAELHGRIAPLLADVGSRFDAWRSYRIAAQALTRDGRDEQALAFYRDATSRLPREFGAWQAQARLERKLGHKDTAVETLLAGRRRFRRRGLRPQAIALLRQALEIAPSRRSIVIDLARLLARTRQEEEALLLLERSAERATGRELLSIRSVQWRITPTLRHTWLWLRAAQARNESAHEAALEVARRRAHR
ncbi:MAG: hypothetical protein MJE66_19710 [Proteobacteria bacterium]|nr:hypothetical protein [Pseudomonadota bacterium]